MPGDLYAKVAVGQDVTFDSGVWNSFIDAAKAERDRKRSQTTESTEVFRQGSIIYIKNESGANLLRTSVLGISTPMILPSENLPAFQNAVLFRAITPVTASKGKFVILQEPIASGKVGRAAIAGVFQVKVNIVNATHKCCDIAAGVTDNLITMSTGGSCQLLWVEGVGTGITWAVVRLGNRCVV